MSDGGSRSVAATGPAQRRLQALARGLYALARARPATRRQAAEVGRVLHVSPALFGPDGNVGGGERAAYELARAVARQVPTTLVSFGSRRSTGRDEGLAVETYASHVHFADQYFDPLSYRFLGELAKADVVHCHQYRVAVSQIAILASAAFGKPTFVTDRGGVGLHFDPEIPVASCVTALLPMSRFSRERLPDTIPARVIPGGTSECFLREPAERTPAEGVPRVLYVGRIMRHKGIDTLIEGLPDQLGLTIAGQVHDEEYWALLRRLADGRDVRFIHDAGDAELARHYRDALVTVLPSVYRDVFGGQWEMPELLGNVLLESMACETPTICTDVGGMPEVVAHGATGFVVPPNDPGAIRQRIAQLLAEPRLREEMGRRARKRVMAEFTWERAARCTVAAYRHGWSAARRGA